MTIPTALDDLLLDIIGARIMGHERSLQTRIGPSGLGTPCLRKLGFRLAETPPVNNETELLDAPWRPTVGTAVHDWLHHAIEAANTDEMTSGLHSTKSACRAKWCTEGAKPTGNGHTARFLTEHNVVCGTLPMIGMPDVPAREIDGTADLYDRLTKTVVDWKVNGPGKLKDYRALINAGEVPSVEYRVQAHTYGRGLIHAGFEVEHVAILFLPMNGELREAVWWTEPYDPDVGKDAFNRARRVIAKFDEHGVENVIPRLKRHPDMCAHCPYFAPGAAGDELADRCPGAPQMLTDSARDALADLLGTKGGD